MPRRGAVLTLLLALCACALSPEAARKKLAGDGIPFTPGEFVRRAGTDPWPTLELFLRGGMDPNMKADADRLENVTALMVASRAGRREVVQRLCEAGANVNAQTRQGDTALIHAASANWPGVVAYLLLAGADVHHANRRGQTALTLGIPAPWPQQDEARAIDCVNMLLAAGARVDGRAGDGTTPLHEAIARAQLAVVRLLLLRGADPNRKGGKQNKSPLRHAIEADQPQTAEALLRSGADPKEPGLLESVQEGLRTNGPAMHEVLKKGGVEGDAGALAN
jgi:ankyrin repeat protein